MKRITLFSTIFSILIVCVIIIAASGEHCNDCFSPETIAVKLIICGFVIIVGTIYYTLRFLKTENIVFDIESEPLREADEAVDGVPFAGEGIIEGENGITLQSPYTNTPCVYSHSIKEKCIQAGRNSRWEVVENTARFVPFYLKGERSNLGIDLADIDTDFSLYRIPLTHENTHYPKNSEIDCDAVMKKQTYIEEIHGFLGVPNSTRYRRSEYVLTPGTKVFVYGMALKKGDKLSVHEDERRPLIISKKPRDQYVNEFYKGEALIYISHFLIATGFTIALLCLNFLYNLNSIVIWDILFLGDAIIAGSAVFSLYNRIVTLRQRALNALSNIEIDLKRRTDLIPELVSVVKEYSKHEGELQQIIAETRAEMFFSKEQQKEIAAIIPSLAAVIENYPELKAVENFQFLMSTLVDTEGRIAYSREFYNRSVRKHNTLIDQFPFIFVAWCLGIKNLDFVSISRG